MSTQQDISGSYVTPDGKAQIDFGIRYQNGSPTSHASGHYDGSSGQCIAEIAAAYDLHYADDLRSLISWWKNRHLKEINPQEVEFITKLTTQFPAVDFYDSQASRFLASNGLKFRATISDSKTPSWVETGKHSGHHYRVTLSRKERCSRCDTPTYGGQRECGNCGQFANVENATIPAARLVFDFWGSIADAEKGITTVTAYDVLACISGDAYTPETFEDFCSEYGDDPDSLKALQTFRRCSAFAKRLRAFFTPAELDQLSEIQ